VPTSNFHVKLSDIKTLPQFVLSRTDKQSTQHRAVSAIVKPVHAGSKIQWRTWEKTVLDQKVSAAGKYELRPKNEASFKQVFLIAKKIQTSTYFQCSLTLLVVMRMLNVYSALFLSPKISKRNKSNSVSEMLPLGPLS
jgi:hypothetical protein